MEQELKSVKWYRKWWQVHNKCMMLGLVGVLLVLLAGWIADRSTDSSHFLSTASIVVSIALSLVVIGYAVAQNIRSEINADKVGRLIESLGQQLGRVEKGVTELGSQMATQVDTSPTKSGDADTTEKTGVSETSFNLMSTSPMARLFAYFLLRSHSLGKPLYIEQFVPIVFPLVKMSFDELKTYVYGILHGMMCGLTEYLTIVDQNKVHLLKLPTNFERHVKIQVAGLKQISHRYEGFLNEIDSLTSSESD